MVRLLTVAALFGFASTLWAQDRGPEAAFADADKNIAWREDWDGAAETLQHWQVSGGMQVKDGLLVLDGPRQTVLKTKTPLGNRFKILVECRTSGALKFMVQTRELFSGGSSSTQFDITPGAWGEILLVGQPDQRGAASVNAYFRILSDKKTFNFSQYGTGQGSPTLSLEVPPGGSLEVRRIRVQSEAPPENSGTLFVPLIVLGGVLAGIMALGWFLNRRKSSGESR